MIVYVVIKIKYCKWGIVMRYVKIFNQLTNAGSDKFLTPNELWVYTMTTIEKNQDNEFKTSLDVLKYLIRLGRNKKLISNKKEIEKCIRSMVDKKVIDVEIINKNLVSITFLELEGGYERLYIKEFERMCNERELSIYMAIKKWKEKRNGAIYSYDQWAEILNVSRVSAISIIEQAVKDKLILKVGTAYSSETGANNYFINKNRKVDGLHCVL